MNVHIFNKSFLLGEFLLFYGLDDTDSDGLLHVSNGESSEGGIFSENFNTHGFHGDELDHTSFSGLDTFGELFNDLTRSSVDLGLDFSELTGDVGSMAIEDGGISVVDFSGVVHDDNLSDEADGFTGGVILGIRTNISSLEFFNGKILNIESYVVSWVGLSQRFMMHFNWLNFSGELGRGEDNDHTGFHDSGFNSSDGDCSDTTDLVDVLKGETEGLISVSLGGWDFIKCFEKSVSLVPAEVGGFLEHVISMPAWEGDEWDVIGIVSDLLKISTDFLLNFGVTSFRPVTQVHFIGTADHLLNSEGEGKECVFSSLSILWDTSFEFSYSWGNHKNSTIGLWGSGNHVFDEISVSWGINNGTVVNVSFKFPEGDIDGDTTFSLSLKVIKNPCILEWSFSHFVSLLFEFLDGSFINTSEFIDQMSCGGWLTRVDVTNNNEIDMGLFFSLFSDWH